MTDSRRWFRFSLRTLFVFVTVAACGLGYNRYHNYQESHVWVATIVGDKRTADIVTDALDSAAIDYICAGSTVYGLAVRRKDAGRARNILRAHHSLDKAEQLWIHSVDHPISDADFPYVGF